MMDTEQEMIIEADGVEEMVQDSLEEGMEETLPTIGRKSYPALSAAEMGVSLESYIYTLL